MDVNRKTAYFTLLDVEEKKSFSHLALKHHITCWKPNSPTFVRELVYGTLENKIYIDYIIQHFLKTPVSKMKNSDLTVLRMGIYQLDYMNSVPAYAAVNESVILAKKYCKGREGMINGVLRAYQRNKDEVKLPDKEEDLVTYLSVKYSYEPWIIELWLEEYEPRFVEELLNAGNGVPPFTIRVNTLKTTKEALKEKLTAKGFSTEDSKEIPEAMNVKGSGRLLSGKIYQNGLFSVQDESSMKAVNILDPQPGDVIVDVCAAPGGKTMFMAERMKNRGVIYARDIYRRKIGIVIDEAEKIGTDIVECKPWDATKVDSALLGIADKVLVDAPCSGLGVIRRKPEIKFKKYDNSIRDLPKKQYDILYAASKYVKAGGVLVYSTCTISPYENQRVIRDFLRKNPWFVKDEMIQLLPNAHNTDGFFICKMHRK